MPILWQALGMVLYTIKISIAFINLLFTNNISTCAFAVKTMANAISKLIYICDTLPTQF